MTTLTSTVNGSSTVHARAYTAVHLHSARVTHTGGVIIDCTTADALTITPTLERTNR